MSTTNRPPTRWSSSSKSSSLINPSTRKKPLQSSINYQHTLGQRAAKTRHDVEELFKLYYTANIKFDTFQRQIVTGTRIPSAHSTSILPHHLTHSSMNVFRSKHCVSREDESPRETIDPQIINDEPLEIPAKRTVEVRIDHPHIVPSISPVSDVNSLPVNSDISPSENPPLINESTIIKSIDDIPNEYFEYNPLRRSKSTLGQQTVSSVVTLPPIMNNRRDFTNLSHSSFSTHNSNQTHIVTGSAVIVRERSPTKSPLNKQRIKSTSSHQPTNFKTSPASLHYSSPDGPLTLGTRVVSIPSKCSRYVLVTFPEAPIRYNAPTYVERLLLPERFPTLFQNIVHNRNNK